MLGNFLPVGVDKCRYVCEKVLGFIKNEGFIFFFIAKELLFQALP